MLIEKLYFKISYIKIRMLTLKRWGFFYVVVRTLRLEAKVIHLFHTYQESAICSRAGHRMWGLMLSTKVYFTHQTSEFWQPYKCTTVKISGTVWFSPARHV